MIEAIRNIVANSVTMTIGQGVTGISTLAIGSFLSFAAIVAGAVAGVKYLERHSVK